MRQSKESAAPANPRQELSLYLSEPLVTEENCADVLLWWKNNSSRYPVLSEMAANYLAIQASSVPCKCLFSSAGLVDTKRRNCLGAERFGAIEYIKAYYLHLQGLEMSAKSAKNVARKWVFEDSTLAALEISSKRARLD